MAINPLSLMGSVGGLALGAYSINSQNQANAQNMALNRELMAFQKYQYADQKRYNSISEQARRIRAAGLNPALLMQNGTLGTTGSSVGSPSFTPYAPVDTSPAVSAISDLASLGSDLGLKTSEEKKNEAMTDLYQAQTVRQLTENKYADNMEVWKLDNYRGRSALFKSEVDLNNLNAQFAKDTLQYRVTEQRWKMEMTAANAEAAMIAASYLPAQQVAEFRQKIATAYMSVLTGVASVKTAMANVMNAYTNRHSSDAQFGSNQADRAKFFNKTLNMLSTAADKNQSEEFRNTFFPWSYQVGSDNFGHVSHNTVEGKTSDYEKWKSGKKH